MNKWTWKVPRKCPYLWSAMRDKPFMFEVNQKCSFFRQLYNGNILTYKQLITLRTGFSIKEICGCLHQCTCSNIWPNHSSWLPITQKISSQTPWHLWGTWGRCCNHVWKDWFSFFFIIIIFFFLAAHVRFPWVCFALVDFKSREELDSLFSVYLNLAGNCWLIKNIGDKGRPTSFKVKCDNMTSLNDFATRF